MNNKKNYLLLKQYGGELACVNPNKCPTCIACKPHYINYQYNSRKCEDYCNLDNKDLQPYIIKSTDDIIAVYKPPFMYVSIGVDNKINKIFYLRYIKIISKSFILKKYLEIYKLLLIQQDNIDKINNIKQNIYKTLIKIQKYNIINVFIEHILLNKTIAYIKNTLDKKNTESNTNIIKRTYIIYNNIILFIKKSEFYKYYNFIIDNYFENNELKNMTKIIYPNDKILPYSPHSLSLSNMYSLQHFIMDNLDNGFMGKYKYKYGICNRLDLQTSGIIICAKSIKKYIEIRNKINNHSTFKFYITLVNGVISEDIIYTKYNLQKHNLKFDSTRKIKYESDITSDDKPHKSVFLVIKRYDNYTLCLVRILTGHHHQIRASIQTYGYPIVSDDIYCIVHESIGKQKTDINNALHLINSNVNICPRLFLHAMLYKIDDFEVFSVLPPDLCYVLSGLHETEETINNFRNYDYLAKHIKILSDFTFD